MYPLGQSVSEMSSMGITSDGGGDEEEEEDRTRLEKGLPTLLLR